MSIWLKGTLNIFPATERLEHLIMPVGFIKVLLVRANRRYIVRYEIMLLGIP